MRAYLISSLRELMFCRDEALDIAEGTTIISGSFEETSDAWTGIFTSDCGQVYEINNGYILKEVA